MGGAIDEGTEDANHRAWMALAFKTAADGAHPQAWLDLGRCLWNGWGVKEDREAALTAYKEAARLGCPDAPYVVAFNLFWHFERYGDARPWVEKALAGEDAQGDAHYLAGLMAYGGKGRKQDVPESFRLQTEAARRGNADAMFELALCHAKGVACAVDHALSAELMRRAAERGQMRACYNLGAFHASGAQPGFAHDPAQAVTWYERAAGLGHGRAAATLAVMYRYGEGVETDAATARRWFARAAELDFDVPAFLRELGVEG